ncbi:MAG: copper chaperone PCu(A)C [Thaumarchaeota archaeon]|nr:copper chaperone PCu(A)C [Candidatus Calditenuaceae archaeon]MDW8041656.1 copper chaperone PCu(A)C [Nitrososphaerota archaeon]
MKRVYLALLAAVVAVVAALGVVFGVGSLPVAEDVAARHGTKGGAIFLNLRNNGFMSDCVIGVEVHGETKDGKRVDLESELHTTVMEGNVMRMIKVDRVCVGPFSTVRMRGAEGEGYHVMVFGEIEKVAVYHVYLKFQSGKVLHFHVQAPTAAGQTGHDMGGHKHG